VEHEGKALAADETDAHHHRTVGMASVHVRAAITWVAIFPLAAVGMSILAALAPGWPPVLRAFTLTLVVVPIAVYFAVPRLLLLQTKLGQAATRTQARHSAKRNTRVRNPRRGA
jgi:ABC-type siderophore export system fused ATPase/permease subunit